MEKSFADNFYQHAFAAAAVKFALEDLFPRIKVEFAFRDGHHDLASHDLAFQAGIGVVPDDAVVVVLQCWLVRREFFQPIVIIMQQTVLSVIDINAGSAMRCDFATSIMR